MHMIRAVVFDFDYTLADSSPGVIECVNTALVALGFRTAQHEDIRRTIGLSLERTFRCLTGSRSTVQAQEFVRLFIARADEVMVDRTSLFPSVRPTIEALVTLKYDLGIVSTKYRRRIEEVLAREDLLRPFTVIVGGEDVTAHKPDPTGLLTAIARLHRTPDEILYVGDNAIDAEAAARAGTSFAAILSGMTQYEELAAYKPLVILRSLEQLPEFLVTYR